MTATQTPEQWAVEFIERMQPENSTQQDRDQLATLKRRADAAEELAAGCRAAVHWFATHEPAGQERVIEAALKKYEALQEHSHASQ